MVGPDGSDALSSSVLVLNRLYMPVHIIGVRRAFGLLYRDLAEVIHVEDGKFANYNFPAWLEMSQLYATDKGLHEDWVRTVRLEVMVPRVIRLLFYDRMPRHALRLNRHSIFARDEHRCQYCGTRLPGSQLSLDHVVPRSRGGGTTWENVVCACLTCNVKKGGRTPKEARMKLMRSPFRPKRSPLLSMKLRNPKYSAWKSWIDTSYCEAGV